MAKTKTKKDKGEAKPAKAQKPKFGIQELVAHVNEETGKNVDARRLRALIRKMARTEGGGVSREVSPDNRARYSWSGPNDPEVKAIVKAVKNGALERQRKESLDKLKKGKKGAKPQAADVDDESDDSDDDDDEELDDDDDE